MLHMMHSPVRMHMRATRVFVCLLSLLSSQLQHILHLFRVSFLEMVDEMLD